jgi:hypothetical protein
MQSNKDMQHTIRSGWTTPSGSPTKHTTATAPSSSTAAPKQCSLLGIPGELRNLIYGLVVEDEEAYLMPDGKIKSKSSLICVNKQIHTEYLSTWKDCPKPVTHSTMV